MGSSLPPFGTARNVLPPEQGPAPDDKPRGQDKRCSVRAGPGVSGEKAASKHSAGSRPLQGALWLRTAGFGLFLAPLARRPAEPGRPPFEGERLISKHRPSTPFLPGFAAYPKGKLSFLFENLTKLVHRVQGLHELTDTELGAGGWGWEAECAPREDGCGWSFNHIRSGLDQSRSLLIPLVNSELEAKYLS